MNNSWLDSVGSDRFGCGPGGPGEAEHLTGNPHRVLGVTGSCDTEELPTAGLAIDAEAGKVGERAHFAALRFGCGREVGRVLAK